MTQRKLILYFSDGFAWDYVRDLGFMPGFWNQQTKLKTLLGYSSSIVPSLISGRLPRDTGVWTEYFMDPSPPTRFARLVSRSLTASNLVNILRLVAFRLARKLNRPAAHRLRIPLQLAHLFRRHDMDYHRFPPVDMPVATLADIVAKSGLRLDFLFRRLRSNDAADASHIKSALSSADVVFVYDSSLDAAGHQRGAEPANMGAPIARLGRFIEDVARGVELAGAELSIILFSDHGMTTIKEEVDLLAHLQHLEIGKDYVPFLDSTFGRFWYPNPAAKEAVHNALRDSPGQFLTQKEIREYGLDFNDTRYGEDIFVVDEGVVIHPNYIAPTFLRTRKYPDRATHGYRPEYQSSYGVFMHRGSALGNVGQASVKATQVFGLAGEAIEWLTD